ncbi:AraC family transcriptional regulator [uncultured Bacteroides sp.]|uniref:AraC family transcriptional regulator n=1 Tax=uncultured Bacteroides sp. TaxID=162156 RepID=UPI002AAA8FAC|nr:AraC family transcriptional regulator [uncultured Bacteroides sp.]
MVKIKSGFMGERAIVLPAPIIEDLKNDELGCLLHITDIGFYPKADFHFRKRTKEETKQYILMYCVEGEGWFEIDGIRQKVLTHHFFIIPKGKAHAYGSNNVNPWTIYWIHFDGEKARYFAEGLDKPILISPEKDSRIEERLHLFEEIFSTLRNGYSKNNLNYSITSLFHFLGSLKFMGAYRESLSTNQQPRDVADEAIHFMRENIRKRLTLKEISDYVGFSSSHFSMLFQKKTGYSPLNYLSQLKIQEACHYLDFSDLKINQISSMIGFDDPFYFSRIFTKTMGSSPSEYRSKKKG